VVKEKRVVKMENTQNILQSFSTLAFNAASTAGKYTQKGVNIAGGIMGDAVLTTADAVGLKDKVEAADKAVRNIAAKGKSDANRAVNRARRIANKALVFDDEEDNTNTFEYDLLLSAAGAVERNIAFHGNHSQTYNIPSGSGMVWKARVKKSDIEFSVREMNNIDSIPIVIEPAQKYGNDSLIQGILPACERSRNINIFFDNSHAHATQIQRKTVVYWVSIGENVSLADDGTGSARQKEVKAADEGPSD
jgi:hypothetical protein